MASPLREHRRVLAASLVGTAVEFYDFYVYATAAALVFGKLFFPAESTAAQQLLSFMSFGLAFVARPVGAIAFGHFGDRLGRKSTLVASLLLMGISTLLIAALPTYAMVGPVAPLLLCILRFGQGFGLGGEWGGATLLAFENAPKGWESRFGAAPQLGAPVGFLAANGLFLLLGLWLNEKDFATWGWRIPFVLSAILVGIGLWVRLRIGETLAYRKALEAAPPPQVPLGTVLRDHWASTLAAAAGVVSAFAIFYLSTAFALSHMTATRGVSRETMLALQLAANVFLALGIVLAAIGSDKFGGARMLAWGAAATIVLGLVFGPALAGGSLMVVFATLAGALLVMGFVYGPLRRMDADVVSGDGALHRHVRRLQRRRGGRRGDSADCRTDAKRGRRNLHGRLVPERGGPGYADGSHRGAAERRSVSLALPTLRSVSTSRALT